MRSNTRETVRTSRAIKTGLALLMILVPLRAWGRTVVYLEGTGYPVASLLLAAPTSSSLPNYDPARDALPGLLVARGGNGVSETDPSRYQQWVASGGAVELDGPMQLEFWAAIAGFAVGVRGVVDAFLLDCDGSGVVCTEIAHGSRDILDWSGGFHSWGRHAIGFGRVHHAIPAGRSLAVRVTVGADSQGDMMFAYGSSAFPAHLTDAAIDDIAVDCDFSDWSDGAGVEFVVDDQGGPDDWSSPAKLDVTRFGASSNLVDSFELLMALDDVPAKGGTIATLIDTDRDNFANYAVVAAPDGSTTVLELYRCDDTLIGGCGNALLERTYPATQLCTGTAPGPWNTDTMVEASLPFNDVGVTTEPVVFTSLVSYASASLLNAPKDSVLGSAGQDYTAGFVFDPLRGYERYVPRVGTGFTVRRSSDPATVRSATAHAATATAPYDDLAGTLSDGQSYFYVVEKDGGLPEDVSASANRFDGTVRLGFDDDDPVSAPVDASATTVAADVSSAAADGTSVATVTVVPRDLHGVAIGAGCGIVVDALALGPASVAGPVIDRHDGSYSIRIAAVVPGTATVAVTVEGIALSSRPSVAFE